jgi:hypothetical protein
MPLDPAKRRAYEKADYVVFGAPEIVLHIGERSAALDTLLTEANATSATFISSDNPNGELANEFENQAGRRALETLLNASYSWLPGEGRDPNAGPDWEGEWPAEPSALVLDMPIEEAIRIGRVFSQNAIVYVEKGKPPELVVLV